MNNELRDALSIVELEERHEMTVAAADMERCNITGNDVDIKASGADVINPSTAGAR